METIALIARKLGMTRIFESDGTVHPVTVLEVGPCPIVAVKRADGPDGYDALQLAFEPVKAKALTKPQLGLFAKHGMEPHRHLREVRLDASLIEAYQPGQILTVDEFAPGDYVDVIGHSKGRGYSGVMRRHGFHGSKEWGHGTHEYFRHGGSIGQASYPGRVMKGLKMAGQYGNERFTIQNLRVIDRVSDRNLLLVNGAVPGAKNGIVMVRRAKKVYGQKAATGK